MMNAEQKALEVAKAAGRKAGEKIKSLFGRISVIRENAGTIYTSDV